MGVPRIGFRRGLDGIYDYVDNEFPAAATLMHSGEVFWVNSATGVNDLNHGTREAPLATLDYAVGRCTANQGDMIVVCENHAETITGVGGIAFDVAGINVIGLGTYNQRPRFLMDGGTTVTAVVSAADVTLRNLVFASGHASVACGIDITAANATLRELEFVNNTTSEMWVTPIKSTSTTDQTASGLRVLNCRWIDHAETTGKEFIELNADVDNIVVSNNFVCLAASTVAPLIFCATGKDLKGALITWNYLQNASTQNNLFIDNDTTANTGIAAHNRCKHKDVTTTHTLFPTNAGLMCFDNLSNSTATTSGFVMPAIDADS